MKNPKYPTFKILKYLNNLDWQINSIINVILYDAIIVFDTIILVLTTTSVAIVMKIRSKIPLSNKKYIYKTNTSKINNPKLKYQG